MKVQCLCRPSTVMTLPGFLCLLLITGGSASVFIEPPEPIVDGCSKTNWDVIQHLNLTKNKDRYTLKRPVESSRAATEVTLALVLYAILDVKEKEQLFVSYIWLDMLWDNPIIQWEPKDFCGIKKVLLPTKLFWKPDVSIQERTEKDKATESPYLYVGNHGEFLLRNAIELTTTCKIQIYKFPFDTQRCNLSFKSVIHRVEEMVLRPYSDANSTTSWTKDLMRTQSNWKFKSIKFTNKTVINFEIPQSMLIYTIIMERRSTLYIVNFILPILLFLSLDLASFGISERGGEKLSFKVTVLLAVTVMQLLLNDILPSSSDRIPLIAIYCVGTFALMMLSLLETILVMHLMEKDRMRGLSLSEKRKDKQCCCFKGGRKRLQCGVLGETSSDLLSMAKQVSSSQLTEASQDFEEDVLNALSVLLNSRKEELKNAYGTKTTRTVNRVFFIFYIITVVVFLVYMFYCWNTD